MGKLTIMLITAELISKIFGFFREITLSYFYGASSISDAYLICTTIPIVIFTFIGTGLSTSFIPVYSEIYHNQDDKAAERFTSNLINLMTVLCSIIILLCYIFTPQLVRGFASGFSDDVVALTVRFTRYSIWGIYFSTLIFIGSSYLNIKNRFILPPLTGIVFNSLIIFSIFISSRRYPIILAIGTVVAIGVQSMVIIWGMIKKGFRYTPLFNYRDPHIKHLFYLTIPVIFGISATQINVLIDRTLSSRIAVGGVSTLVYANRLIFFIQSIFVASIGTILFPRFTRMAAERNTSDLLGLLKKSLITVAVFLFPITIGAMIFSEPIIRLLYGRGAFGEDSIRVTSITLFFYSLGIIGTGFRELLLKAFYSHEDTKKPTKNTILSVGLNIILNLILSKYMGIPGLALATSIASSVCALLLFIDLRRSIGAFEGPGLIPSFSKLLGASLLIGGLSWGVYLGLIPRIGATLSLFLVVILGSMVYAIAVYIIKVEYLDELFRDCREKISSLISGPQ